jgi:poly(beta-D-mannuronate) lyase
MRASNSRAVARRVHLQLIFTLIFALLPISARAKEPLRSPWDAKPVALTEATYKCSDIVHLSPDLTTDHFYSDSKSSVIDPALWKAYVASSGPYKQLGQEIVDAADAYRTTGSRQAAVCATLHMETAAKDGVFTGKMSSNQAYYVQGWVIGAIAIAYLKVRGSGLISAGQQHLILPWVEQVVRQTMDYYDPKRDKVAGDGTNNHLYWAGVEVSAAGIAANNRALFDWGMKTFDAGVAQIQPDGTLPLEMRRGQRALHYHLFALSPLVYLAEFGEVNGLSLYAKQDFALKKLAVLSTQGLVDNSLFAKQAGVAQDTPSGSPTAEEISWAPIYIARFPDPAISKLIAQAHSLSYMYLGGLPPS